MIFRFQTRDQRNSNSAPMFLRHSIPTGLERKLRAQTGSRKAKMAISELQIRTCTVLLVDQNFGYHIGVITRKQVKQSRICGTFYAFHFRFGRTSFPQVPKRRYSRLTSVDILSESAEARN